MYCQRIIHEFKFYSKFILKKKWNDNEDNEEIKCEKSKAAIASFAHTETANH